MHSVDYYVSLLEDRPRIASVLRAISRAVTSGDNVVEIGCGIGTYSLAALRAGAAQVTAIDANPVAIALARELGVERDGGGRIRLVESRAESVLLFRPAGVVIFEDNGTLGHAAGLPALFEHVRTKMAAPGAKYLPAVVEIVLAPVDRPLRTLQPSEAVSLPFSSDALALLRKRALNEPFAPDFGAETLAAPGQVVGRIVAGEEIPRRVRMSGPVVLSRSCSVTGLLGWIRLDFGDGIVVDNPPSVPPPTYAPVAFPFEEPLRAVAGERLELSLEAVYGPGPKTLLWQWGATGTQGRRDGSSTNGLPGDLELLKRGSTGEIPKAGKLLPAIAEVCRQVDGKKSSGEIASVVYNLYKGELKDERAASAFVLDVMDRLRGAADL